MEHRKLGIDLDGVLVNFSDSYARLITKYTGLLFPKVSDTWPTEWFWERTAGVTPEQEKRVWGDIVEEGSTFWQTLAPMPEAKTVLNQLNHLHKTSCDVYFLTDRMGAQAKHQTEKWLYEGGIDYPTVILIRDKTPVIRALRIDFFIDDKLDTVNDLARVAEEEHLPVKGHIWLKEAPYNRVGKRNDVKEARGVIDALKHEDLW